MSDAMDDDEAEKKVRPRAGDADVLALAEGLILALPRTFDRSGLQTLQGVAASYPDVGRDGAGEVVASLIGLIDDLLARELADREALAVHVRAWRYMVSRKPDKAEKSKICEGLRKVRELYDGSQARAA